jgi:hypothetical protein
MNHIQSPDNSDAGIEREILAKGLTAPRVTPADIEANIASEHYFTAEQGAFAAFNPPSGADVVPPALSLLTFCVLVLQNGFTVTGESACASPENFDAEVGRKIARANAVNKIWPLMGYALKQQLHTDAALRAALPASRPDGMLPYNGTKTLLARPMARGEYNTYRGWVAPEGEDQDVHGYLVEYADGGKPNDPRHEGYISWSPADVFEKTYRRI